MRLFIAVDFIFHEKIPPEYRPKNCYIPRSGLFLGYFCYTELIIKSNRTEKKKKKTYERNKYTTHTLNPIQETDNNFNLLDHTFW